MKKKNVPTCPNTPETPHGDWFPASRLVQLIGNLSRPESIVRPDIPTSEYHTAVREMLAEVWKYANSGDGLTTAVRSLVTAMLLQIEDQKLKIEALEKALYDLKRSGTP